MLNPSPGNTGTGSIPVPSATFMDHVKIQINSGEALARLLGEDPAFKVEFKDRVLDALLENHIRPLFGADAFNEIKQKADNAIKKIRDDFVADHVTKTSSYTADKSLKPEINKMIREQTMAAITTEVQCALTDERERIQKAINELFTRNEKALETFITKKIDAKITEVLSDRLNVMTSHLADLSKYYADELRKQREKENNETRKITLEL